MNDVDLTNLREYRGELEAFPVEKEPLWQSERFRFSLAGVILELLILFAPSLGLDLDPEVLKTVAGGLAAIVISLILGRSYRNTTT
jgi:hypothetical protein